MPKTPVGSDFPQAVDVLRHLPPQGPFHRVIFLEVGGQQSKFFFSQGLGALFLIQPHGLTDLDSSGPSYAEDVGQGDDRTFLVRDFDSDEAGHWIPSWLYLP